MTKAKTADRKYVYLNGKMVRCSRLIMEGHLGRELLPDEVVHHKDEDSLNDDIANLEVLTDGEHRRLHRIVAPKGYHWCSKCGKLLPVEEFRADSSKWTGLRCYCKQCSALYTRDYWRTHKDKKKQGNRRYYLKHKDAVKKKCLKYRSDTNKPIEVLEALGGTLKEEGS